MGDVCRKIEKESRKRVVMIGMAAAVVMGLAVGWLRYWVGFFILVQGAVSGLAIAWVMGLMTRKKEGHPGFGFSFGTAGLVFLTFMAAQAAGFGLAQPWFEPLGWAVRVWDGRSVEFVFGVAATAGVHRGFAMGLSGGWWILFSLVDWAIMFFFLLAMPWPSGKGGGSGQGLGGRA